MTTREGENDEALEGGMEDVEKLEKSYSDMNHKSNGSLGSCDVVNAEEPVITTEERQHEGDAAKLENNLFEMDHKSNGLDKGNKVYDVIACKDDSLDHLVQMVMELNYQNEYLKAQFEGLRNQHLGLPEHPNEIGKKEGASEDMNKMNELHETISSLKREIQGHKETQIAAEHALNHLRMQYSEADARAQELSVKLIEAQQKMEQEIKERDDKYVELDTKFGRLHKRAKQRIQEVQKEKDDVEARLRDLNEMCEKASSQQSSLQQELERTRQQANEALRSMDVERQQLRTANNKFRDSIDEMHRSLEAKENALEGLQQSIFEKEQMLEDMRASLQAMDEKRLSSIAEISAKHQKQLESLETQLADALSDRTKAAETISSLQALVAEKESEYAELDAASTGEAVRLGAAIEAAKGEIIHLKNEHEKERQSWNAAYQALKAKLEVSESTHLRSEIEAAKMRSQLELELSVQNQLLNARDAELTAVKEEINRLESEFSSYKVRAHALLQKKDAEILAAKDTELIKAQEEAVKEAEREAALASAERDRAMQDLQDAMANHDKELSARDAALGDAEQRIRIIERKLDSSNAQYISEREAWQRNLETIEDSWRLKYKELEAQNSGHIAEDLQKELLEIKLQYKRLQEEHDSFRDIADRMIEEKDKEISRLLDDNKCMRESLDRRSLVVHNDNQDKTIMKPDAQVSTIAAAEQQILNLARQQAQREEELSQSQRHILALQDEIEELERENRLHHQQETMLKSELRNMERMRKREGVDMTYLKNVILKLLETGEVEALLPVIGTLLQFSPDEIKKCQQAYSSLTDVPPSPSVDGIPSGSSSLFSKFSFS